MSGYWEPADIGVDPNDYAEGESPVLGADGLFVAATPDPGLQLSSLPGEPLGAASAGVAEDAAPGDHVHPLPSHNELTGRDAVGAHPVAAVTGLQAALDVALDVASTGGLVPVNVGTPTVDDTTMTVTFGSVWGIDADGTYYNAAGVTAGDAAGLFLDTTTGELTTIALETR